MCVRRWLLLICAYLQPLLQAEGCRDSCVWWLGTAHGDQMVVNRSRYASYRTSWLGAAMSTLQLRLAYKGFGLLPLPMA